MDVLKNHWDAVGALGQWFASLATVAAVIVAIWQTRWQSRPKVLVKANLYDLWQPDPISGKTTTMDKPRVIVTAINVGTVPVTIVNFSVIYPKRYKRHGMICPEPGVLPKTLKTSEEVDVWTYPRQFRRYGIKHYDIVVAIDNCGRIYCQRVGIIRRIQRLYWWWFGKMGKKVARKGKAGPWRVRGGGR